MRWFVIQNDEVINVVVYDGGGWTPPRGCHIIPEVEGVGIGWTYDEETGRFVEPEQETNEQS